MHALMRLHAPSLHICAPPTCSTQACPSQVGNGAGLARQLAMWRKAAAQIPAPLHILMLQRSEPSVTCRYANKVLGNLNLADHKLTVNEAWLDAHPDYANTVVYTANAIHQAMAGDTVPVGLAPRHMRTLMREASSLAGQQHCPNLTFATCI